MGEKEKSQTPVERDILVQWVRKKLISDLFSSFGDAMFHIEAYAYYRLCSFKYLEQCNTA